MEYNEIPLEGETGQEYWPEDTPDTDGTDMEWNEEFDQYLDYIDSMNPENRQPANDYIDLEPYVDTGTHKQKKETASKKRRKQRRARRRRIRILLSGIVMVAVVFMIGMGGKWVVHQIADLFQKEPAKTEVSPEVSTEPVIATTEEATTEDPYGPYATTDYVVHKPHATGNTIVFDSNRYSLKSAGVSEDQGTDDETGTTEEPTLEDIYPAITLTPVEGSWNAANSDPSNPGETQQMTSKYMVLLDLSDDTIVAKRDSDVVINPASMTKILTVLTATDMIKDLDDTYVMKQEEIHYAYAHDCSAVGFLDGETVTVRDLIYGTIVCSGADAAVALADYCCGSQEAFVEKMNEKVADLGISDTAHFTNVVGIYDEDLHCTMEDMAVILATAIQNDLCRDVLSTRIYTTTPDPSLLPDTKNKGHGEAADATDGQITDSTADVNPDEQGDPAADGPSDGQTTPPDDGTSDSQTAPPGDGTSEEEEEEIPEAVMLVATTGIEISNWFMRRIEDKQTGGEVLGAKTGYVNAAGFCSASYYKSNSGKEYICVTGDTYSSWRCIYDHVGIYRSLAK